MTDQIWQQVWVLLLYLCVTTSQLDLQSNIHFTRCFVLELDIRTADVVQYEHYEQCCFIILHVIGVGNGEICGFHGEPD